MITERAPAKINLTLRVVGRRADGYHLLESLVAFAELCDVVALSARADGAPAMVVDGPFAESLEPDRAAGRALTFERATLALAHAYGVNADGLAFAVTKNIPVAGGLGGGSADAAAALRALDRRWGLGAGEAALAEVGARIGADVPACVYAKTLMMRGVGEHITPLARWPALDAVLVNPRVATPTPQVFARYAEAAPGFAPASAEDPQADDFESALDYVAASRNDLAEAAMSVAPAIAEVLDVLGADPACRLARMSGSGATCFGLYADAEAASAAAARIASARPGWWARATRLEGAGGEGLRARSV